MVLQFMWKKDFLLDLSLENSTDSYFCFLLALHHSVSPLSITFFVAMYSFWLISSKIDEILLINRSGNVFVFGDFNIHYRDWLTYSGRIDRPGELCNNFSVSNYLTQIVTFPAWILDCDSHDLPFWLYFFLLMLVFVQQWLCLHWEILIMLLSQSPLTFQ